MSEVKSAQWKEFQKLFLPNLSCDDCTIWSRALIAVIEICFWSHFVVFYLLVFDFLKKFIIKVLFYFLKARSGEGKIEKNDEEI